MSKLLQYLSQGPHPVIASRAKSVEELKHGLERGYLLIRFTDTEGETELNLRVLPENIKTISPDNIHVTGDLILDYTKAKCEIDLQLPALNGTGYLHINE